MNIFIKDNFIDGFAAKTSFDCFLACIDLEECSYYTWYSSENAEFHEICVLFSRCDVFSETEGCDTSRVNCNEYMSSTTMVNFINDFE